MDNTTQNSILNFTSNVSGYTITLEKDEQKVVCNQSNDNENCSICSITSNLSKGSYSLLVVNFSTNETIINIPNVINIYKIETVNIMKQNLKKDFVLVNIQLLIIYQEQTQFYVKVMLIFFI